MTAVYSGNCRICSFNCAPVVEICISGYLRSLLNPLEDPVEDPVEAVPQSESVENLIENLFKSTQSSRKTLANTQ